MATIANPNALDDENQQQQNQGSAAPTQPISVGGSAAPAQIQSAPAGGAPAPQQSGQPQGAKQGSGRFQNIQKYINANQDANYAGKIGESVQNQQNKFNTALNTSKQAVDTTANAEQQRLQAGSGLIQQVNTDPNAVAANEQNVNQFNQLRAGTAATVGVDNQADLSSQQAKLNQTAQMAGTESGRFQLLRDTLGKNSYTQGQNKLDQLILQGQSGQLKNLNATTQNAAKTSATDLQGLGNTVNNYNQQIQASAAQAKTDAQKAIDDRVTADRSALEQRVAQTQAEREGRFNQFQQSLASGQLSGADAQRLGLGAGQNLMNLDLTQYINPNSVGKVGVNNVATAADNERFNALAKLSGQNELASYAAPGEALGAVDNFDKDRFLGDVATKQSAYNQELTPLQQMIQQQAGATAGTINQSDLYGGATTRNGIKNATGIDISTPAGIQQLAEYYASQADGGRGFREGVLGNNLSGQSRDALINNLNSINSSKAQMQELARRYGTGRTLGVTE